MGASAQHAPDQVLPHLVGQERHHRRHAAHRLHERVPERLEGGARVLRIVRPPEPRPRQAHVPVGEVIQERLEGAHEPRRVPRVEGVAALSDQPLGARDEPAVERPRCRRVGAAASSS